MQTFNEVKNVRNIFSDYKEPTLELTIIESQIMINNKIILTPCSINGKFHKYGEKFTFGKNLNTNSFNFHEDEEDIADNQFEIFYDERKISFEKDKKKFYIKEDKYGKGLFLKIVHKIPIYEDIFVSFCQSYLQIFKPKADKVLRVKFVMGPFKDKYYHLT